MKTIIEMAREAGLVTNYGGREIASDTLLERFATLVRADERDRAMRENAYVLAERDACAKVCDAIEAKCIADDVDDPPLTHVAAAIRARGNT